MPFESVVITLPPAPRTSLVGRDREIDALSELLRQGASQLITLTGPGGVGKTRIAFSVARSLESSFPGGVIFVDCTPLRDPTLVIPAIARALGMRETDPAASEDRIVTLLGSRRTLLLLDNFEHVVEAAPALAHLLIASETLQCLVTSRAPLRVYGEHVFPILPLTLPPPAGRTAAEIATTPAVQLFVARAQSVRADFTLTDANATQIARLCRALDGLPLAIELAAARLRYVPPAALLAWLDGGAGRSPLDALAGGWRDSPARHQALRETIRWSYDQLDEPAQLVFRRVAAFSGGFTVEAAESVLNAAGSRAGELQLDTFATFEAIASLIDNNLIVVGQEVAGEPRFSMLATIHEFAAELAAAHEEDEVLRDAHAAYYGALVERAAPELHRHEQVAWFDRLEADHANIQTALCWLNERGRAAEAQRLTWLLWEFWWYRGHLGIARHHFDLALHHPPAPPNEPRIYALIGAARLAWARGDAHEAESLIDQARQLREDDQLDDPLVLGLCALVESGVAAMRDAFVRSAACAEAAIDQARAAGDPIWLAAALNFGLFIAKAGDQERGTAMLEEALEIDRASGGSHQVGVRLSDLGVLAHDAGDRERAHRYYVESIDILTSVGDRWYLASPLAGIAALIVHDDPRRAARLLGAAEAYRALSGLPGWPTEIARDHEAAATAKKNLGEAVYHEERANGQAMSLSELVENTLQPPQPQLEATPPPDTPIAALSAREAEVLRLLIQGRSDREIAEELFISPRTASKHVANILAKLDVSRRSEAAIRAMRLGFR